MTIRRSLAACCLIAALSPVALTPTAWSDEPQKLPDPLPAEVQRMIDEALAKHHAAPPPAPAAEQLPSLEQMRIWYAIQREKLGENNEEVRDIAMMIRAISPPTFSIDFPGGTVAEYLAAIRKAFPGANIVGTEGLDQITVPAITLKDVTLEGALRPLTPTARRADGTLADVFVNFSDGVAAVSMPDPPRSPRSPRSPFIQSHVWNLSRFTDTSAVKRAQVVGAIEAALSVVDGATPVIKVHAETGILVARGAEDQLRLIDQVVEELTSTLHGADSHADR